MPIESSFRQLHYVHTGYSTARKETLKMTIQDFTTAARRDIRAYLDRCGDTDVMIEGKDIVKANDTIMHGFILRREGSMAGANIYLDDLFERHEAGEKMDSLMHELECRCRYALECPLPPIEVLDDLSLENIRPRLTVRLLDARRNMSYMAERPYIDAGNGLVMAVDINCDRSITSEWKVAVTEDVLESIGCSREELLTAAMENTITLEPPLLMDLPEYLSTGATDNFLDSSSPHEGCFTGPFILTNSSQVKGAAVLFYPGMMERISDIFRCGYYVLPISIHEVLIIPDLSSPDVMLLQSMLLQGNREIVDEEDVLSDKVFHYSPADQQLSIAASEAA